MTAPHEAEVRTSRRAPEWERVALLGVCVSESRRTGAPEAETVARLRVVQERVLESRANGGAWDRVADGPLNALECDVLACVVAPEIDPRIGLLFQSLQPGHGQPFPSPALIHELLALDDAGTAELREALDEDGPLLSRRLVEVDGGDPYRPLRPGPGVADRVLDRPVRVRTPPGAVRVRASAGWSDLVLPEDRMLALREFLAWVRQGRRVAGTGATPWGGPIALFTGPSGTGKTLAGMVLASELGWPLLRVDLGRLVSRWLGETEKNINHLLAAVHGQPVLLQIDESDALLGRRGEIREARDRYANMEVSHLLSRLESHVGPCILTTNLRQNIDPAFVRRFQMVIEFPLPDASARHELWRRLLPAGAPCEPGLDLAVVATSAPLSGGGIRNAAMHAAVLAADRGDAIGMSDVALAVWREQRKSGRELTRSDLGPMAAFLSRERAGC